MLKPNTKLNTFQIYTMGTVKMNKAIFLTVGPVKSK